MAGCLGGPIDKNGECQCTGHKLIRKQRSKTIIIDVEVATQTKLIRLEEALAEFFRRWEMMEDRGGWSPNQLVEYLREATSSG